MLNKDYIKKIAGLGLFLSAFCLISTVAAQSTGGVKGKVKNLRGDNLAGATVTVRQNSKDLKTAKSDKKGEFILTGLETGIYNIVFDAKGYSTGIKYNVEIKENKTVNLGDRLILQVDKGTQVIVQGSVFFKDGTSVPGAEVRVERVNADGSTKKVGTLSSDISGEFSFRQPEGNAKFRITAKYKDTTASKEIEVNSPAIYRLALSLDISRPER